MNIADADVRNWWERGDATAVKVNVFDALDGVRPGPRLFSRASPARPTDGSGSPMKPWCR